VESILKVKNLNICFSDHCILNDVSFELERDTTLAVIGPNGSGKTLLFKALLGLIEFEGKVDWNKEARIGYVPQKLSVEADLPITVAEFLELKEENKNKVTEILTTVGFKKKAEHIHHDIRVLSTRLGSLSGGELQRVLLAYALLKDPNVLLLDEPTAGVDIEGEESFYELFARLKKDTDLTIIFISHDMEEVEKYSDKILELGHHHKSAHMHDIKEANDK
jgi:zinc transport system ATP-binding protein